MQQFNLLFWKIVFFFILGHLSNLCVFGNEIQLSFMDSGVL